MDLARKLKKLRNMKLILIAWNRPYRSGKRLRELEIRGIIDGIQTTALLKLAIILGRVQRPEDICCHSIFRGKPPIKAGLKNTIKLTDQWCLKN